MIFSTNGTVIIGYPFEKNELGAIPHIITKINQKWITKLSEKPKTIKLLEEDIKENRCDLGLVKIYQI